MRGAHTAVVLTLVASLSGAATAAQPVPPVPAVPKLPAPDAPAKLDVHRAKAETPPVKVEAKLAGPKDATGQPKALELGDVVEVVISVTAPQGSSVFVPDNPAFEAFEPLPDGHSIERSKADADPATEVHRFKVVAVRLGAEAVPAIEIPYRLPDGTSGEVTTKRLRARIRGRLVNEQNPKPGAAPGSVPVIATNWTLIWVLTVLGSALAAALLTFLVLRLLKSRLQAAAPPPPPRPANELALEKLKTLSTAEIDASERYARTIDVLREYLGGRYGFDGLESTTGEIFAALEDADLKEITRPEIDALIEEADLIKFARLTTGDDQARKTIHDVRRIVELTWEEPEEEDDVEAIPRLERANARERLRAGAFDFTLAALAGFGTIAGFWISGYGEWGWLGIVVLGMLMGLRDVAGIGSPGKALWALAVVTTGDRQDPPPLGARLKRNALLWVPFGVAIEALLVLYHPLGTRLGDRWSGTEVVRLPTVERREATRPTPAAPAPKSTPSPEEEAA